MWALFVMFKNPEFYKKVKLRKVYFSNYSYEICLPSRGMEVMKKYKISAKYLLKYVC